MPKSIKPKSFSYITISIMIGICIFLGVFSIFPLMQRYIWKGHIDFHSFITGILIAIPVAFVGGIFFGWYMKRSDEKCYKQIEEKVKEFKDKSS